MTQDFTQNSATPSPIELSPEQEAIVAAPLHSFRVAAGAGTGKTFTVAHRVAHLVREGLVEPEEVLGMTFTNKAAEELADRIRLVLADEIDDDRAISIHTYHGFASDLLREFGALVGVERSTELVTPTFARQIMADILSATPIGGIDVTSPVAVEYSLHLAAQMANNLVDDLDHPDEDSDISLIRRGYAHAVALYRAEKRRLKLIDYGDMIAYAHQLLNQHHPIVEAVRSRYRVVVLDEYQDTDPAQRELLRLLFGDSVPVMAVGDEDQTIYEWRGASLDNFRAFPEHFPNPDGPAPTRLLTLNRRSAPEILDLANEVRSLIDDEPRPHLRPLPETARGTVRRARLGTSVDEASWIASDILERHGDGHAFSDMAILFRKNRSMLVVHQALSRAGVPFQVANLGGLLSVPEVVELHSWLRILERPTDGPAAVRVLTGSSYRLGLGDLGSLARWVRRHDDDDLPFGFLEAVDHLDDVDLADEPRRRLTRFRDTYRRLLTAAQGLSLVEVCRSVLDETHAWTDLEVMDRAAGLSARLNLYRFLDMAESWSPLDGRPSLGAFLDYLDLMADNPAEELDVARIAVADAVSLITVHRAKGLEWPIVYLPAMAAGTFPTTTRFDDPFCKPQSLPLEHRLDRSSFPPIKADMKDDDRHALLRHQHLSQEQRLFYVAVTRAKTALILTSAHWYGGDRPNVRPSPASPFWEQAVPYATPVVDVSEAPDRPETLGDLDEDTPTPDPLFTDGWAEPLRRHSDEVGLSRRAADLGVEDAYRRHVSTYEQLLLDLPVQVPVEDPSHIDTSVTGLVTYSACPQRYFWSHVDRLPRRPQAAARRGVRVHRQIELHNLGVVPLTDETDLEDDFDPSWEGSPGTDPFTNYRSSRFAETKPVLVEMPFELRVADNVWAKGRVDAIYAGDRWEVVDFKTGRPRPESEHLLVQLQAYSLAVIDAGILPEPAPELRAGFVYLGGDGIVEQSHIVDRPWLDKARNRLAELADGLVSRRYEPTPSDSCRHCDFIEVCPAGREFLA